MKRFLTLICCFFCFFVTEAKAYERILSYDTIVQIHNDSSIEVTETISVVVEGKEIRLGLERDFPLSYYVGTQKIKTPVTVNYVKRNGQDEHFWTENIGGVKRLFLGAEEDAPQNRLSYGVHTYTINWTSEKHIRGFENLDELYFNAIGHDWNFDIEKATARVYLAEGTEVEQAAGYIGYAGSTEKSLVSFQSKNFVEFEADRPLKQGEGLTVAVGFTKGVLTVANTQNFYNNILQKISEWGAPYLSLETIILILSTLATFIFYLLVWNFWGKDRPLGTIVPSFRPSEGLSPIMAGALWGSDNQKIFVASLVGLAAKGYVQIGDKEILRTDKEIKQNLCAEEENILNGFKGKQKLKLGKYDSTLSSIFADCQKSARKIFKEHVAQNRKFTFFAVLLQILAVLVFADFSNAAVAILLLFGLTIFYLPFLFLALKLIKVSFAGFFIFLFIFGHFSAMFCGFASAFFDGSLGYIPLGIFVLCVFLCMAVHCFFYSIMDKPDEQATKILAELKGLQMFIKATDENRYKVITPDVFEKNLPFAILFGLEKKWLDEFKELTPEYKPSWYSDPSNDFGRNMVSSFSSAVNKGTTNPASKRSGGFRSSSGGFSGSGGGGSSGGGSGGGGGRGR